MQDCSTTSVQLRTRILIAIAVTVLYALCYVAIKASLDLAPPLRFAGLRALVAGLALLGLVAVLREPAIPPSRIWRGLISLAVVATTMTFGAMFLSPGLTGAGIASVLGNSQPLFAIVLAALFLGERLTSGKVAALALGLVGVMLISYPALSNTGADGASVVVPLLASIGSAAGFVIVKRLGQVPSLLAMTGWAFVIGSLPLLSISLVVERANPVTWSLEFLGVLLFLAVPGTALATAMWFWLIQRSEVGRLAMLLFPVPILGLGLSAAILGERIGAIEGAGVVVVIAGIGVTIWEIQRATNPRSERPAPARGGTDLPLIS